MSEEIQIVREALNAQAQLVALLGEEDLAVVDVPGAAAKLMAAREALEEIEADRIRLLGSISLLQARLIEGVQLVERSTKVVDGFVAEMDRMEQMLRQRIEQLHAAAKYWQQVATDAGATGDPAWAVW